MGLDSYAYAAKEVQQHPTEPCAVIFGKEDESGEYTTFNEVIDLNYWRKFNALHSWMDQLYQSKGGTEPFNCLKIPLTLEDLQALETTCKNQELKPTTGFFFGSQEPVTKEEYLDVLSFIKEARDYINKGYIVCYDSWW